MSKIVNLLLILFLASLCNFETTAQIIRGKKSKSGKSGSLLTKKLKFEQLSEDKSSKEKWDKNEKSIPIHSPFRYIILSNLEELEHDYPQRRLEVLMDKKAFNERNLKLLISLLKKRFPLPIRLEIKIHTNLATIETPEESEMVSNHTQLEDKENYYKTAFYIRYEDSVENLSYAYGRPPGFWWKSIILNNSK